VGGGEFCRGAREPGRKGGAIALTFRDRGGEEEETMEGKPSLASNGVESKRAPRKRKAQYGLARPKSIVVCEEKGLR